MLNDGGNANDNLTVLDWFAGKATEDDIENILPRTIGDASEFERANGFKPTRAWARYEHAAAMLAERKRRNKPETLND